jgi:hypothetical protein
VTNVNAKPSLEVILISSGKPVRKISPVFFQDGVIFSIPLLKLMD